jgi:hypothetical protein
MQLDLWYDLVMRELSGTDDAARALLKEAETASMEAREDVEGEDGPAPER